MMSNTIVHNCTHVKCIDNSKLKKSNTKVDELDMFNIILDVSHLRSKLPFANKFQPQGASVLYFFAKTL